ncbi:MAG: M60 family metallopeptidase [Planctomycetota bacterium]
MPLLGHSLALCAMLLAAPDDADRKSILGELELLERHGVPGTILVFGDDAFAVLTANDPPEAVVAAARFGGGRVVAFAHNAYIDSSTLKNRDTGTSRLFEGALAWSAQKEDALRIGILGRDAALAPLLEEAGHTVHQEIRPGDGPEVDVLVWKNGIGQDEAVQEAIRAFVREGGGLIAAVCPWGYEQVHERRGLNLRDHLPENQVLAPMGLVFAKGYAEATADGGFAVACSRPQDVHAGRAFDRLLAGEKEAPASQYLVEKAIQELPRDDQILLPRITKALASLETIEAPRPDRALSRQQALARLSVSHLSRTWKDLPVDQVRKAPGIDETLGAIPADAERVTRSLVLDPQVRGWQGTGLYLPPGEVMEIQASGAKGWSVRIGCHTDHLWHQKKWRRWPEIAYQVGLGNDLTRVATPFGGTVYFEADRSDRAELRAEVSGVVEAPRFQLSDPKSARDWRRSREAPGPWAELEGEYIVISVPSSAIRAFQNPAPLVRWWDGVLASHCALAGTALPDRRERIVPDVQISAGYMHSGYPIMTHLDVATPGGDGRLAPILDLEELSTKGNWGLFHELGHNRQKPDWTFAGTGEVTCNLFTLYTSETMAGIRPWANPWLEGQKQAGLAHLESGAPFQEWQQNPGVALLMYAQIQKRFGWKPFQQVFGEVEQLTETERPKSDQDRIDQWMTRMSLACERDLRPFFRKWGLPLSGDAARDPRLDHLREWLPDFEELRG